ncbi:MAG: hypothetical protein ACIAQZ_14565 [Sedimentisphaeraceae bacterium JB056]
MSETKDISTVFTKNRTEELGYDVWKHFVVPPFFDKLDLKEGRKPCVIVGGRGCGKTMLLRYLSHQSIFSPDRVSIDCNAVSRIGLYWRADTQFARLMIERGHEDDVWESAFRHLLALVLGIEILNSILNIEGNQPDLISSEDIANVSFKRLLPFGENFDVGIRGLIDNLENELWEFDSWVANARRKEEPSFLPGDKFLHALVSEIQRQVKLLENTNFFVYVDEYENLHEYQQRIINTYLKHSESPLIFNIAMKRNGFKTTRTDGDESINDVADYRVHDIDQYLIDHQFPIFAAEVLYLNLEQAGYESIPIDCKNLRNPESLNKRRCNKYKTRLINQINKLFPGKTEEELSKEVFQDTTLNKKIKKRIEKALKSRNESFGINDFYDEKLPKATIINSALLYRSRLKPQKILEEFNKLKEGKDNDFTGRTNWIHNNFIGCLLSLYESHSVTCEFYSGFETFCSLSRGNLRHFLELCHKSVQSIEMDSTDQLVVSASNQAIAARQTSAIFLEEVSSFGRFGNKLHSFTLSLGSLFALSHRILAQSEPERSHFVISKGESLTEEDFNLLKEAVKWSVLFKVEETKIKDPSIQQTNYEYILNPIYSPYFNITYRKKRKIELKTEEIRVLINGNYEEKKSLLKSYSNKWKVSLDDANPTLFSHLLEEGEA